MSSSKKFYAVILIIISILAVMCLTMFIVDPIGYYRYDENNIIRPQYSMPGIVNNYPHNVEFIGSSMTENMDIDRYDAAHPGSTSVKLTVGAMTFEERLTILRLSRNNADVDTYIIDMYGDFTSTINVDGTSDDKLTPYLHNDTILDDYKYLLGYEPWLKFIPEKIASLILGNLGITDSSKETDLNRAVMWHETANFNLEQKKYTAQNYADKYDLNCSEDTIKNNIDVFIEEVVRLTDPDDKIIFYYSPFSVLYWNSMERIGAIDIVLKTKKMFVEKCSQYDNIKVLDFQSIEEITDLSHYKDRKHHDMTIQNMILDEIDKDNYLLTTYNVDNFNNKVINLLKQYQDANADWLNK